MESRTGFRTEPDHGGGGGGGGASYDTSQAFLTGYEIMILF
jgi:hypothetical protein